MFKAKPKNPDSSGVTTESTSKSAEKKGNNFRDWRRRVGEQTLLKFGLASEVKDEVTGNIEGPLNSFNVTVAKAVLLEDECKRFCECVRAYLGQGASMTFLSDVDDDAKTKELSIALNSNFMKGILVSLVDHIEVPIDLMRGHIKKIHSMVENRAGLLLDYQHHKRKYDAAKSGTNVEEQQLRKTRLEGVASELKEVTLILLANFAAFEYTYPRLRIQMSAAVAALNGATCKTMLSALRVCDIVTNSTTIDIYESTTKAVADIREGRELPPSIPPTELEDYTFALHGAIESQRGIFGRDLSEFSEVPEVVLKSIGFLDRHGLYIVGIFRIPGKEEHIANLKRAFNEGYDVRFEDSEYYELSSVYDVASLLKLFFRELPNPLIPRFCYRPLLALGQLNEVEFREGFRDMLSDSRFHPSNADCLRFLLGILSRVVKCSSYNKMTSENLAIVFAPTLLRPVDEEDMTLSDLQSCITCLKKLIDDAENICENLWEGYPAGV